MVNMETEAILCFQHCERNTNIICQMVPPLCPLCGRNLAETAMRIPPFRIPCPFTSSKGAALSVVIRPTHGTFLRHYTKDSNLHIGVTNSKGEVFDYDESGVHISHEGWFKCLPVQLVEDANPEYKELWDSKLSEFAVRADWSPSRYSENNHNCYDFVLSFLQYMGVAQHHPCVSSHSQFVERMVVPHTSQAAKYITLYRKVQTEGIVVQPKDS